MQVSFCYPTSFVAIGREAFKVMEHFCACPEAKNLISEQTVPVEVTVGNFSNAKTDFYIGLKSRDIEKAVIKIPKSETNENKVTGLAFEILNFLTPIMPESILGAPVSMDRFARERELEDIRATEKQFPQLLQNCQKEWGVDQKQINKLFQEINDQDSLIEQEIECHTDAYRRQWIKLYQKTYCKDHPEDLRSCKTTPQQLCNHDKLKQMPEEEMNKILIKRLCAFFPQFSERGKEPYSNVVQKFCPEILAKEHLEL
jgi:hypothetical protein